MDDMLKLNVTLSRKLKVKEEIQADYLDMIAHLESVIAQLQEEKASTISNVKDSSILSYCQIDDYETEDAEVTSLTEALNVTKKRVAQLTEQLKALEEVAAYNDETSDNDDEVARSAQADEVKRLKDEISKVKTTMEQEKLKHCQRIRELEEGRDSLQKDVTQLERQLKECESKLLDTQTQCEVLKSQPDSTRNERGNSAFSELEDRRRRAEKLIVRQRETISRLKLDLHRSVTENRRKFNEYIAKMAKKYNNDDEINKLLAERESLLQENAKLMHEVQILEEIELDRNYESVKVAVAFNLVDESHQELMSTLVNRCRALRKKLNITVQNSMKNRQRLIDITLEKCRLQDKIWHYTNLNSSLSSEIAELQSKLASLHNEKHCSNENANIENSEPKKSHGLDSGKTDKIYLGNRDLNKVMTTAISQESQEKEKAEENTSTKLSLRNDGGSTTTTSTTTTTTTTTTGISRSDRMVALEQPSRIVQCNEVPQECTTS
uniref:Uncharacterized protein n=1 Tax=Trichobilharzia regenti TaxID=157069 RepID=A0AA85KMB4_TRIRE|nr:unnamed protein product [Trichobilharzia regenti]